ncbi:WD40/YVTN/BNR-like repeat-containing protein [Algoriphagus sp.]|uniref:WD40/YVTN/BNR-like repeat-containing protein n=1 Tax=Algoriphagus sp. TaxID=1872435 RepID=UPI003F72A96D
MKHNSFQKTIFAITSIMLLSCNSDNDFERIQSGPFTLISHSLEGITVNEFVIKGDMIFAATSDGIYSRKINSTDVRFTSIGLKGKNIQDIHAFTVAELLASSVNFGEEKPETKIYKTTNEGKKWEEYETDFGGAEDSWEGLGDFESVPSQPHHLYATGSQVVAKSIDKGKTWEPIWGDWGMIGSPATMKIKVNPLIPTEIWGGGQGGIENGFLFKTKETEQLDYWDNLVLNPTVVKEIVFDRQSPQSIYVGWEGELSKSMDNGNTWTTLIDRHEEAHFFFGIGISPNNPNLVFAGKWIKGGQSQPLEIFYSMDKGETWDSHSFQHISEGGIWDLKVVKQGNKDRIFLGLDKGGIAEIAFKQ